MFKLSTKIAFSIIVAGLFILVAFTAFYYENLNSSFYFILPPLLFFIFLFGFATGRNYAAPIKKLIKNADDISRGNVKSKFDSISKDEIGELAKTFGKIVQSFEKNKYEVESLKKSADIKFKTKDLLSKQLVNALEQKIKNRSSELDKAVANLEKLQEQLKLKDAEIIKLNNQINKLSAKKNKKKT